jgi:ABC-type nitrate/sulfonate/bicarbonate transport system substrate-binding protein
VHLPKVVGVRPQDVAEELLRADVHYIETEAARVTGEIGHKELRAKGSGRVVVNSTVDRPWSQYFCCMLAGSADYVENHPVATKRVVRDLESDRSLRDRFGARRTSARR